MLLKSLSIRNFRCYDKLVDIPLHRLTVFIGGNDAGKTVMLHALELLLTNKRPTMQDFRQADNEERSDTIVISGSFALDEHDSVPEDYRASDGATFILTKTFTNSTYAYEVAGRGFDNPDYSTFERQPAANQKILLSALGLEPEGNLVQRVAQLREAIDSGRLRKEPALINVQLTNIEQYLPRFEYVSSSDYKQPDAMIGRTLQAAVDSYLRPIDPETETPRLRTDLAAIETDIQSVLNAKVADMYEMLRQSHPKLKQVRVDPKIDFAKSVSGTSLMLDLGEGYQYVDSFGEGTKKKLWMGLLEWERKTHEQAEAVTVLRVYDEPDVNLDYQAEQKLFSDILDTAGNSNSRVQTVVCTHAITLINQASPEAINHIHVCENNVREIRFAKTDGSADVQNLLSGIGQSMGMSNISLFYDRAFLVVEGESEENALPILYQNLYNRTLAQDGIVLVNLHTNGAWKAMLKFLHQNRADMTILLLDQDSTVANGIGIITRDDLVDIGFPEAFLETNCHYIGNKEFEDAFETKDILSVLNAQWPRQDRTDWTLNDVDQFRGKDNKFSEELKQYVRKNCRQELRNTARKPEIARELARHCTSKTQIPDAILEVFSKGRIVAGIEQENPLELEVVLGT